MLWRHRWRSGIGAAKTEAEKRMKSGNSAKKTAKMASAKWRQ